ncbi:surface lipoprotein assembly modifier [Thalassobius sp. I31.1]|uniref:surface lipoprotein assembly modifier n=1 Tax=Thalassobius sp. I31.1 TaxID=2109912 RepID=UPI001300737F|nr:surface lipoprotein assembly modifier [Thalassobius sp. I31.1]
MRHFIHTILRRSPIGRASGFLPAAFAVLLAIAFPTASQARISIALDQTLIQLAQAGNFDSARQLLAQNDHREEDRLVLEGRIAKLQRRLPEATHLFRQALLLDPGHIIARRELAHSLLLARDFRPAEHHFNDLLNSDPDPRMRDTYRNFLNTIHQNKTVGFSGFFAFLPSTNINRGTTNTTLGTTIGTFVIDEESQESSGIGAQFGLSGFFRHIPDQNTRYTLNWSASRSQYAETQYNGTAGSLSLTGERFTESGRWFITPYYRRTWKRYAIPQENGPDAERNEGNEALGLSFGLFHRISPRNQLHLSFGRERRDYEDQKHQDAFISTATASLTHQFNPDLSLTMGLGLERNRPQLAHLQHDSHRLFGNLTKAWEGGLRTSFGLEIGSRNFVGEYPLQTFARDDEYYKLILGLQHNRINFRGFTPVLNCSHTINRSNVAFFDYNVTECQAAFSRNF